MSGDQVSLIGSFLGCLPANYAVFAFTNYQLCHSFSMTSMAIEEDIDEVDVDQYNNLMNTV